MRKIIALCLTALMLTTVLFPTALAVDEAAAVSTEGTEETTATGADEGAAESAEKGTADELPASLTTTVKPSTTPKEVCYPTSIDVRDEGAEIRKIYDLSPDADPAGIPRTDFEHAGFYYMIIKRL